MKPFKIRCSQIGKIMTQPRNKSDLISKTTQSYLEIWIKEQIYERSKEFSSKFTEKGKEVENESIEFAYKMLNLGMMFKNSKHYSDDFIEGTPDIVLANEVIEMKNSWDCFSFPLLDTECPNDDYDWQIQGYLALTGKQKGRLIYTLMDTPDVIIQDEIRRQSWKMGFIEIPIEFEQEIIDKMTYPTIPDHLKIKVFEINRDEEKIKAIYDQVKKCREYIDTIINYK